MIPLDPNWRSITNALYARYGSYSPLLDALAKHGCVEIDHSVLCRLRSGERTRVPWRTGAALLNLYEQLQADQSRSATR